MNGRHAMRAGLAAMLIGWAAGGAARAAAPVTLVADGKSSCCVVVSPEVLAVVTNAANVPPDLLLPRYAADDLVTYFRKMSGAEIAMADKPAAGLIPIYVGCAPQKPAMTAKSLYGDAYLIDVSPGGIVLHGESGRAVYYAAARLLHALGVRWYAPGEMGEHVPQSKTLKVEAGRTESVPSYNTRGFHGERWSYRNRLGGPIVAQGHAFAGLMEYGKLGPKAFEEHPDYYPMLNGKPSHGQANLSSPKLMDYFSEQIGESFRRGPTGWAGGKSAGIGPDDGLLLDERPESRGLMSGRKDVIFQVPDTTDLLVNFVNAVAGRLEKEFPDHTLGFYVYSNHEMPPMTVRPHRKMIVPVIAPISFSRFSSIGNPRCPVSMLLKSYILEWKSMVDQMGFYLYNFNLADTAMPFTRTLAFSKDLKNLHAWGLHEATIESMVNWHLMIPGNYLTACLLWDVNSDVPAILDETYRNYYGPAAGPMRKYNETLEQAYENTDAFAGAHWSMHRILTPEVMKTLEKSYQEAEKAAKDDPLYSRRVGVTRYTLNFAKLWFAAHDHINAFDLAAADRDNEAFVANFEEADKAYPQFFSPYIVPYWKSYHYYALQDGGRVAREGDILYRLPDELTAFLDSAKAGEAMGLHLPESNTSGWMTLRTYSAMIDEQGFPFFRGLVWYRHDFTLPASGRKAASVRLWLGGLDGPTAVYLNGKKLDAPAVKYNFGPLDVDLTPELKREGGNTLVFSVDNTGITELGTAGLVRPALLYVPRKTTAAGAAGGAGDKPKGAAPLFAPQ